MQHLDDRPTRFTGHSEIPTTIKCCTLRTHNGIAQTLTTAKLDGKVPREVGKTSIVAGKMLTADAELRVTRR